MRRLGTIAFAFAALSAFAQERGELKEDLWYKVTQAGDENKYLGFLHLTVETVQEDGVPRIHWFAESQLFPNPPHAERGTRDDYWFDSDLVLLRGQTLVRSGDLEIDIKAVFDGKVLTRATVDPALEFVTPWSREKACWPMEMIPVALMKKGGVWEVGRSWEVLAFGWKEDVKAKDGKQVREFTVTEEKLIYEVKGQGRKPVVDVEQQCFTMEVRLADRPQAGVNSVVVDSRGFIVEILNSQHVIRRVKDDVAARNGNKFIWAHGGRRDPFRHTMKPKEVKKIAPGVGPIGPGETKLKPGEIKALLEKADQHLQAMQQATGMPNPDEILQKHLALIKLIAGQIRNSGDDEAAAKITAIEGQANKLYDPVRAALAAARAAYRQAQDYFDSKEETLLVKIAALAEQVRTISQSQDLAGKPEQPQVNEILDRIAALAKRAAIVLEAKTKTKDMKPNGIMYVLNPEPFDVEMGLVLLGARMTATSTLRLPVSHSVVLLGAGSYEEGDPIPELDDTFVKQIRPDGVVISYKGEEIILTLGK